MSGAPLPPLPPLPIALGVHADTGRPLPDLDKTGIDAFCAREQAGRGARERAAERARQADTYAVMGDVDADNLSEAGWGLLFAADTDPAPYLEALSPLIDRRRAQAGDIKIFHGPEGCLPGDTASSWLARHKVSLNVVDPALGVPYYLVLVGPPGKIPFSFQYTLDLYWAVGRLDFAELEDYRRYADSIVAYESATTVPSRRSVALFATCHDFDRATQMLTRQLATPLAAGNEQTRPLGERQGFAMRAVLGDAATKAALTGLLRGDGPDGAPAILLTGSHGMCLRADDSRIADIQGALVCQDWPGYGAIDAGHWFAASDIPADARCHGLIHFCFACFGAGSPELDNFSAPGGNSNRIAPCPFTARLPQRLLAHPHGGALAVLGHVDRAWAYSFQSERADPQTQGFRDVAGSLLRGQRVGQATDRFNIRWAALSTELADLLRDRSAGAEVSEAEIALRWIARDDARNYVVLGDPAARLRVREMEG
ncbi:C25 family cysteine peptidase [Cupriavidus sp. WKF15]|uniref:C25 family cysteine peptidase n=1 Tax=Cupriavidus sp. WKF15 TaxID=3032282 RepID=UPI0023E226F1|nr:C25 family cysteine peptidase [Cupriavidus sp. WKF15]WER47206.1 C25 family cysteine peptidase [Cupriavidus sp. WKF15]